MSEQAKHLRFLVQTLDNEFEKGTPDEKLEWLYKSIDAAITDAQNAGESHEMITAILCRLPIFNDW